MAHAILFEDFSGFILSQGEVRDLIEMLYRWGDAKFVVRTDEGEKKFRGQCKSRMDGRYTITLVRKNIERDFYQKMCVGGNIPAPTLKVAAALVLAHELQHANQHKIHAKNQSFWSAHRYMNRACEREARQFADEKMGEICAYFGVSAPVRQRAAANGGQTEEARAIAELLGECSEVTMDDIREELRASKILNPANVAVVVRALREIGIEIK